jgi:hypothetical protein
MANSKPDLEAAGFTRLSNEFVCDDSRGWSYLITEANGSLLLDSSSHNDAGGVILLRPGPQLDCLMWVLSEFSKTGKLPTDGEGTDA